jgi:hypothetical protein
VDHSLYESHMYHGPHLVLTYGNIFSNYIEIPSDLILLPEFNLTYCFISVEEVGTSTNSTLVPSVHDGPRHVGLRRCDMGALQYR